MRHGSDDIRIGPVRLAAFLLLAGAYCAFPNARPDLTAFNANDSEAYLALSYSLSHGLGYTRSLVPGDYIAHTTWPPGVPLLLAPVMTLMHLPLDWYTLKLPMILIGVCGVALTWLYVRRLTSVIAAADLAAALVALSPFYWHFSRMDMSEVPSFVFIIGSLLLIDTVWAGRTPRYRQAVVIGMIAGAGMLLRGTLIGLALAPLGYLVGQRRARATRVHQLRLWIAYCAGFCVAFVGWAARNHSMTTGLIGLDEINQLRMLFVVLPTDPASPLLTPMEMLRGFAENLSYRIIYHVPEQILPGLWLMGWQDWPGIRWVTAALTLGFAIAVLPRHRTGVPLFLTLVPYCVLMCIYSWGGSFRFWIPITSLMVVLMIIHHGPTLLSPTGNGWVRALRQGVIVTLMLAYAGNMFTYIRRHEQNPFALDFADMVSLFEQATLLQDDKGETLTDHEAIYTFITGHPAALAVPRLGPEPTYSHFVMHLSRVPYATPIVPPPGAVVVRQVGNWAMYRLPVPMTKADLIPLN